MKKSKIINCYCNKCKRNTNHKLIKCVTKNWEDEVTGMSGTDDYEIIECLGCNYISFRSVFINSEDLVSYEDGSFNYQEFINNILSH